MANLVILIISIILLLVILVFGINLSYGIHQADARGIDRHSVLGKLFIPYFGPKAISQMEEVQNDRIYRKYLTSKGIARTFIKWILLVVALILTINYGSISSSINNKRHDEALSYVAQATESADKYFAANPEVTQVTINTLISEGYLEDNFAYNYAKNARIDINSSGDPYFRSVLSIGGFKINYDAETAAHTATIYVDTTTIYKMFSIFFLLSFVFIEQSITVSIAEKKNMKAMPAAFFGLVPFVGITYYLLTPGKKRIMAETISNTYSFKELFQRFIIYFEMLVLCFIVLVPVVYLLGSALTDLNSDIPKQLWPDEVSFQNFKLLFTQANKNGETIVETTVAGEIQLVNAGDRAWFLYWFKNTFFIALISMVFSVLFITGTAYVFARFRFKGKKALLLGILVLQMFPSFMSLIATYQLLKLLNLLNQPYALVFIYTAGAIPYNVWLIKGFLQNIPKDLDESATIDGANKLQIFFKIILPLSLPIITFVAVSQFMSPWMDYILPSYLLGNASSNDGTATQSWTMAMGLYSFIQEVGSTKYRPTLFCAGALIIAIPITVLYVVFQRYLIEGITAGASKG